MDKAVRHFLKGVFVCCVLIRGLKSVSTVFNDGKMVIEAQALAV